MTIEELQRLVLALSNSCFCRYWAHYNYPKQSPWLMAIQVINVPDLGFLEDELIKAGFKIPIADTPLYTIERVDDQGRPFSLDTSSDD